MNYAQRVRPFPSQTWTLHPIYLVNQVLDFCRPYYIKAISQRIVRQVSHNPFSSSWLRLKVSRSSVHALTLFYCGKLDDTETIVPALDGLVALSKQPNLSSEDAVAVIRAYVSFLLRLPLSSFDSWRSIFTYVKMKALVQAVRYHVFSIVDTLLTKHRKGSSLHLPSFCTSNRNPALQGLGTEFISGYASLAEGEKDPRNLLVAFAIARVLLIEFDVSHHVEVCNLWPSTQWS